MIKIYIFCISFILTTLIQGQIKVSEFNFLTAEQPDNVLVQDMSYSFLDPSEVTKAKEDGSFSQSISDNTGGPRIIGQVLNYPNPFKASEGTTIGYYLSENMPVTLHVYDLTGSRIYDHTYPAGSDQGTGGSDFFNEITLNTFSHRQLPSGIYYYVLMTGESILGRGKMAVLP